VRFKLAARTHAGRASCACSLCGVPHRFPSASPSELSNPGDGEWPDLRIGFIRIAIP
jgi:hypothetical protein